MPTRLSVTDAARSFSEILGRVRFRGERFILLKGGKPVAELGPTEAAAPVRLGELPGVLEALPHLDPDDVERFADDLEAVRGATGTTPVPPWAS
ncbi:MAG: antitoxin [Armatimonadota bacterium]|nr:antitoxin [Armatimonadota bacterium]MDR7421517.1 antitoxin [Armatimonadota bacterium]MDR7454881.1 antitoxin [Armatimonadota bacterium]MDR7458003.1 antitoxin [Armatimonadota bacterium]MDR7497027.1 antitoxin [Armatimonadota bacterium]